MSQFKKKNTNSTKEDVTMVVQIMERFGEATGLRFNLEKTSVATTRCQEITLDEVLQPFMAQGVG